MALIAVSGGHPVGIDIERHLEGIDVAMLTNQYFAPGEAQQILSFPDAQQSHAFPVCWTRKGFLLDSGSGFEPAQTARGLFAGACPSN